MSKYFLNIFCQIFQKKYLWQVYCYTVLVIFWFDCTLSVYGIFPRKDPLSVLAGDLPEIVPNLSRQNICSIHYADWEKEKSCHQEISKEISEGKLNRNNTRKSESPIFQ